MQTYFSLAQLADPDLAEANRILRACVHCGFCTATCPTYVLLGDELDSPRGRIYLIKDMLEKGRAATPEVVKHIDRCLSCLSCMTTCPSGVHYQHLVDQARVHIEKTYRREPFDRALRAVLARLLPYPRRFRLALIAGSVARPLRHLMPARLRAMLALLPPSLPSPSPPGRRVYSPEGRRKGRVALLAGCAQSVLAPEINEATVRLLTRHGVEVVIADGGECCGGLVHHMGRAAQAHKQAAATIGAWRAEMDGDGLDAIVVNASGCGTTVKDYGFMFREDAALRDDAARVSAIARDISEYLSTVGMMPPVREAALTVAYHSACSLQHGQKVTAAPKALLQAAGFHVVEPREAHLCCGSAGTYNMLQPELATRLRDRKVANLERTKPDVIAAGNLGCMTQLAGGTDVPIVHTVELLDWATGGPKPARMSARDAAIR
ncbi:MAG: glycolate oxidase subunit GlcF [Alphaproteobacteria bacterium]|nr:glycolate oxidase subunit GlcF [Alphaproteobacteria bacterium]